MISTVDFWGHRLTLDSGASKLCAFFRLGGGGRGRASKLCAFWGVGEGQS